MLFLSRVSRLLLGLTLFLSGFLKLIDPVGTSLIVSQYFKIIALGELPLLATIGAVLLALFELLLASLILIRIKPKFSATITLITISFFTLLTFFIWIFDPISHCGCFGEAIKLTNLETLFKNILLLLLALHLFFIRKRVEGVEFKLPQFFATLPLLIVYLSIPIYSLIYLPMIDFTPLKCGVSIERELERVANEELQLKTILIYTKDGEEYQFEIDNLPDSSYTFVDSRSERIVELAEKRFDFAVSDREGNYITDYLTSIEGPLFIASTPDAEKLSRRAIYRLNRLSRKLKERDLPSIFLSGSHLGADGTFSTVKEIDIESFYLDRNTIYSLNRSSGGVTMLWDGVVLSKWSNFDLPLRSIDSILERDQDLYLTKSLINQRLYLDLSILALFLLLLITKYSVNRLQKRECDEIEKEEEFKEI